MSQSIKARLLSVFVVALLLAGTSSCVSGQRGGSSAAKTSPVTQPAQVKAHFYFAQITDTHFGYKDGFERTERLVDMMNGLPLKPVFVAHTGDVTMEKIQDDATVERGLAILKKLNVPVHFVPGNHDILKGDVAASVAAWRKHFGELSTRVEYEGVVFLFLFTQPQTDPTVIEGYDPLAWLESALKAAGDKPVVIFTHPPATEDLYRNGLHEGWPAEAQARFEQLINTYNVKAVIAGHFHRDELHWIGRVPLYVSSSVAGYWGGRQATFRTYEYNDGRISYYTRYLEDKKGAKATTRPESQTKQAMPAVPEGS